MGRPDECAEGAGPFTTRLTWRLPDGGSAVWESRTARRRGAFKVRAAGETEHRPQLSDATTLRRLRRLNVIASVGFTIGGALFALGAAVAQLGSGSPTVSASIYFAGGLFFNTGGYTSLLQVINAPRPGSAAEPMAARDWRWWSYEPVRIDWLSSVLLLAGTIVFGVNLVNSFLTGLSVQQENRLVWGPDLIGCLLFLASGHLAVMEICHGRPCWHSRSLGWWIVAVNQLGSVFFLASAVAAFTRPATGSLVNVSVANWGTFAGALCFAAAGLLQVFERPYAS
ncbi:hypothetical protein [Streptomyces sp. LN785]|uniref:hypothetical protein n=1 Tax=Streptomyces sp. LN785 TaxID=3112983 RepID=UPI00370FC233